MTRAPTTGNTAAESQLRGAIKKLSGKRSPELEQIRKDCRAKAEKKYRESKNQKVK